MGWKLYRHQPAGEMIGAGFLRSASWPGASAGYRVERGQSSSASAAATPWKRCPARNAGSRLESNGVHPDDPAQEVQQCRGAKSKL